MGRSRGRVGRSRRRVGRSRVRVGRNKWGYGEISGRGGEEGEGDGMLYVVVVLVRGRSMLCR